MSGEKRNECLGLGRESHTGRSQTAHLCRCVGASRLFSDSVLSHRPVESAVFLLPTGFAQGMC